jgi:energy-coupling factor transport system ATP-binding protein
MVVLGADGTVIADGHPRRIFREKRALLAEIGIWCPESAELDAALREIGLASPTPPLSIDEALSHLDLSEVPSADLARARPVVAAYIDKGLAAADPAASATPSVAELIGGACAPLFGPVILRDVNLNIRQGEIVGILGANGAGKSTLGLCLAGLLPLKSGQRSGVMGGVAFQRSENQFVAGSVEDELRAALPKRLPDDLPNRLIAEALQRWHLTALARQHPFELSQGQKRRLALATLTMTDRWPLLVLDEPMAGLDAAGAAALATLIAGLRQRGRAVAVITHDMDMALRLCPRSIIVGEGRVLADGPTPDLLADAELLARADLAEPSSAAAARWLARVAAC